MDHEEAFVRAFIARERRGFLLEKLESLPRHVFRDYLRSYERLDPRYYESIDPRGLNLEEKIQHVYEQLRAGGAPDRCYVMGASELDGQEADLLPMIRELNRFDEIWTILSCIPGKLAYLKDEGRQIILRRGSPGTRSQQRPRPTRRHGKR